MPSLNFLNYLINEVEENHNEIDFLTPDKILEFIAKFDNELRMY